MKKLILPILGILMLSLSGCNNDKGDEIVRYPYVPAIFGIDWDLKQAILITPGETYLAPGLTSYYPYDLDEDDVLIVDIYINKTRQPQNEKGYTTVMINYLTPLGMASPIDENESNIENFESIDSMVCFARVSHGMMDVLYTAFCHNSTRYRAFDYEITYDPDEVAEIPTLYVRAKGRGSPYSSSALAEGTYAFNMYDYYSTLEPDAENKVRFNFKFKTGEDEDGKEIWEELQDNKGKSLNPVIIPLKDDE
jgi:hypothetical protein